MNARVVKTPSALLTTVALVSTVVLVSALVGCAPPTTGPGTPDAIQLQHFEMLKSAIEAKSKADALAAIKLLDGDVGRWQANWVSTATAMTDLGTLEEAVEKGDWALAEKLFLSLKSKYRGQAASKTHP